VVARPPVWDFDGIRQMLATLPSLASYLIVDGEVRAPDFLLRYERLAADFDAMAEALALPVRSSELPHVNRSSAAAAEIARIQADPHVRREVAARFAADMRLFGYAGDPAETAGAPVQNA
jgi:hypothetical protein